MCLRVCVCVCVSEKEQERGYPSPNPMPYLVGECDFGPLSVTLRPEGRLLGDDTGEAEKYISSSSWLSGVVAGTASVS